MRSASILIEDRAGGFAVSPVPPQPAFPRYSGYFADHRAAVRFAESLAIVTGWKVKNHAKPPEKEV